MLKLVTFALVVGLGAPIGCGRTNLAHAADEDSIYDVHPIVDGAVITASVLLTISIYAFAAGAIDTRCPCNPQEVNSLDRPTIGNNSEVAAWASNVTVGVALIGPVVLDWLALGLSPTYADDLVVYGESIAVAGALAVTFKQIVQRPFPRTYAGDPSLVTSSNGYRSFYSGHTTLTFAALSTASITLGERYGIRWWPWFVTAAVGASVAIERVAAGWHFPTDVMVGALAGVAVGVGIPVLHLRRLQLMPFASAIPESPGYGLAVAGTWR